MEQQESCVCGMFPIVVLHRKQYDWDRTGKTRCGACYFCGSPIDRKKPADIACRRCQTPQAGPVKADGRSYQTFGIYSDRRWTAAAPGAP